MEEKSCFNCKLVSVCFVRRDVTNATQVGFLNIDGTILPGKWIDMFKSVANCCFKFEQID